MTADAVRAQRQDGVVALIVTGGQERIAKALKLQFKRRVTFRRAGCKDINRLPRNAIDLIALQAGRVGWPMLRFVFH